jgi:pSer/pThr/pTyr-binding forkhead associated (FHA) protein
VDEEKLNTLYCPKCGHGNALNSTRCNKCGLAFPSTIPVDDLVPDAQPVITLEEPSISAQLWQAGTIVFSIAGHDRPIFVRRQDEISLGRTAPGESPQTVDLSMYSGQKMGVSRRHAIIRLGEQQATIEDLGSANGSWINEQRLTANQPHALNSGDYLRLGHMIIVVHASAIDTLILRDESAPDEMHLTTKVLVERVGPFLNALTDIQQVITALAGQESSPITVHSLNSGAKGAVHVRLSGATRVLNLMREEVMPWRRRYTQLLSQTKDLDLAEPAPGAQPVDEASVRSRFNNIFRLLFQAVLNKIAPGQSEDAIAPHRQTLTTALHTLAFSPLAMSDSTLTGEMVEPDAAFKTKHIARPPQDQK